MTYQLKKQVALLGSTVFMASSVFAGGADHMAAPVVAATSSSGVYVDIHGGVSYQDMQKGKANLSSGSGVSADSFKNGKSRAAYGADIGLSYNDAFAIEVGEKRA